MKFNTANHRKFWAERKIDWNQSYLTGIDPVSGKPMWDHPHRTLIVYALKSFHWMSLWEVGCAAGANLVKILQNFPQVPLGGSDVSEDAIEVAQKTFNGGKFNVESVEDLFLSDNSVDVMLSDATLIYIGPEKIKQAIHEMVRCTRNRIVLCELHEKRWWKRWFLRLKTGYNAYDYEKLLKEAGCFDIQFVKIPPEYWQGHPWQPYGYIIVAKIAK